MVATTLWIFIVLVGLENQVHFNFIILRSNNVERNIVQFRLHNELVYHLKVYNV